MDFKIYLDNFFKKNSFSIKSKLLNKNLLDIK